MSPGTILIVGETRSLADSLAALLESDGLTTLQVADWSGAVEASHHAEESIAALLVASNQARSPSLAEWPASELADRHLIWVGMRGRSPPALERLHTVTLPLDPRELLALIRSVARAPPDAAGARDPKPSRGPGPRPPPAAPGPDRTAPSDRPVESGDPDSLSWGNPWLRVVP
ncbi:MAG: hypothetical protein ACYCPN_05860 [Thermoplasmata archaeon]